MRTRARRAWVVGRRESRAIAAEIVSVKRAEPARRARGVRGAAERQDTPVRRHRMRARTQTIPVPLSHTFRARVSSNDQPFFSADPERARARAGTTANELIVRGRRRTDVPRRPGAPRDPARAARGARALRRDDLGAADRSDCRGQRARHGVAPRAPTAPHARAPHARAMSRRTKCSRAKRSSQLMPCDTRCEAGGLALEAVEIQQHWCC